MWLGGKLFENIAAFIAAQRPDILCLQEVYNAETYPVDTKWHHVGSLATMLGFSHYAFNPAFTRLEPSGFRMQNGNAVLSNLPIKSSVSTFFDVPFNGSYIEKPGDFQLTPRNLQHVELEMANQTLHIFNTQGIWGFDGADNERRLAMGDTIAREVAGVRPALLMGDFNVEERTQTMQKITETMKNVFAGELTTSFNMQQKNGGGFATSVVDMMFVSPDIRVTNHRVATENISDHLALIAEFEVP